MFKHLYYISALMALLWFVAMPPAIAQGASGELEAVRAERQAGNLDSGEINNGTNPTLLTTQAGINFKHYDYGSRNSSGQMEAFFTQPFGETKNMSLTGTVSYINSPLDSSYGFGDFALKFLHVVDLNKSRGYAYAAEVFFDTGERDDLGRNQTVLELSSFRAGFLESGAILAPSLVWTTGLGDQDPGVDRVNLLTFDLYYVPKLANKKFYITNDPALIYDFNDDLFYGSYTVTFGMLTGKALGGDSQVFIKPQILVGGDRPLDWSIQVGFKLLNF